MHINTTHTHTCGHTQIHTQIHICIHTYIHTHTSPLLHYLVVEAAAFCQWGQFEDLSMIHYHLSSRLTFQFNPSSRVYGFHTHDLKFDGENEVSIRVPFWPVLTKKARREGVGKIVGDSEPTLTYCFPRNEVFESSCHLCQCSYDSALAVERVCNFGNLLDNGKIRDTGSVSAASPVLQSSPHTADLQSWSRHDCC